MGVETAFGSKAQRPSIKKWNPGCSTRNPGARLAIVPGSSVFWLGEQSTIRVPEGSPPNCSAPRSVQVFPVIPESTFPEFAAIAAPTPAVARATPTPASKRMRADFDLTNVFISPPFLTSCVDIDVIGRRNSASEQRRRSHVRVLASAQPGRPSLVCPFTNFCPSSRSAFERPTQRASTDSGSDMDTPFH
jgi:hypothetical protein